MRLGSPKQQQNSGVYPWSLVPAQVALITGNACSKRLLSNKTANHSIICTRQEELGNEARFPKVNTTVHCSTCSQLNNTHDHIDIPLK